MGKVSQVTVFGATGFIGRSIVRRLARAGATVCAPTRDMEKALELKPMGDVGQIVPIPCSMHSDTAVAGAIGKSDAVINLIGILYEKGRDTFEAVHVETAARIARLAREQGTRALLHVSALGANAESPSAYAQSKAAGEDAVRAFFAEAAILRPSIVFGPGDSFFRLFDQVARFSPILPLIGGGHTKFQPVYIGDVAAAALRCLESAETHGAVYELGGPVVYTFRELMEIMLAITGRNRCLISLPWPVAKLQATLLELMPHPLLTRDQVELLKSDNIVSARAKTLRDFGLTPTGLETIVPGYLARN